MFDTKINPQSEGDDIDYILSNDYELQPDIYDMEQIRMRKILKDKNKKKYIEHILENKDILNFDDEDLYNEISKNFSDAEVVTLIFNLMSKRIKSINEKALTFRDNIIKKYRYLHNPQKIIEKANKYMRYLNLTPEEKTIFINSFKKNFKTPLTGQYNGPKEIQGQFNSMSKFLNYNTRRTGKLNFESSDVPIIKEIINLTNSHNEMYNNNISHIIKTHRAITNQGITKYYDGILVNPNAKITECIPPIIFALFANVIPTLDKNLLISNIGMIIKKSYEHKVLNNYEQNLIDSLAHDTDEYIDKSGNTLTVAQDLLYRVKIQISLWKLVLFLRTKHIFDCDCTTFYKLLSIYSPDILNTNDNDTCSDSIDIMSKIFNVVNFKPIEYKYFYDISDIQPNNSSQMAPFIIKQGRDHSLYLIQNNEKIQTLKKGMDKYYKGLTKTEKIPFIYIKQSENGTTAVMINNKDLMIGYNTNNLAPYDIKEKKKPYIAKRIVKRGEIESIDNVLIFVVVRTQTVINKQNKIYIDNQPLSYDMGSNNTSFNINGVYFGFQPNTIYDLSLHHGKDTYVLSSVLLYTVYNESLEKDPKQSIKDGLKIKGNPYALVIQHDTNAPQNNHHIIYQPYVLSAFSHSISDESPISAFDLNLQSNMSGLIDIVCQYGEIYIFRNLNDQLISITHNYTRQNQNNANPAGFAAQGAQNVAQQNNFMNNVMNNPFAIQNNPVAVQQQQQGFIGGPALPAPVPAPAANQFAPMGAQPPQQQGFNGGPAANANAGGNGGGLFGAPNPGGNGGGLFGTPAPQVVSANSLGWGSPRPTISPISQGFSGNP